MDKTPSSTAEAPMTETPAHPMSDEPRLVETLKECFADLTKGNELQTEKLLEALKPKAPPTTDKETTFWNAYKTLSEEYDREFLKKYGTDLDTSLIFAGLFSAVSSAFIIQIQPELQQDPNEVTQQLLRVLIHNANQSLFSGIDLAEPNSGATATIVIVQSLLYASLFSTLLAALLAVLGKQWLMHYDAAGSRGTLAERGLERQRKHDGLQRWKFTLVMEMFPLLLQLALLLFSAALSVYLLTISHPIASIVITLTSLGTLAYISLLVSAAVYPDSPFQTPLASALRRLPRLAMRLLMTLLRLPHQIQRGLSGTWKAIRKFLQQQSPLLPLFRQNITSDDGDTDLPTPNPFSVTPFPKASPAVPAVVWLLETSTNPDVISAAADMAADLQWPLHADLDVVLDQLRDTFWACFIEVGKEYFQVRDGSIQHATSCGQAYGTMSISSRRNTKLIYSDQDLKPPREEGTETLQLAQLHTIFNALKGDPRCLQTVRTQSDMLWVLHVLPHTANKFTPFASDLNIMLEYATAPKTGFTKQSYADGLLLLNIMFGFQAHPDTLVSKDKSFAINFLLEELFKNFSKSLNEDSITLTIAKETITSVNQMAKMAGHMLSYGRTRVRKHVYGLCATITHINEWVDVVLPALAFVSGHAADSPRESHAVLEDTSWVYTMLEEVHQSNDNAENDWDAATEEHVLQLLKALNDATEFPVPSKKALQVILKALSTEGPCSFLAWDLLFKAKSWFIDTNSQSTMQEHDVWSQMGVVIMNELWEPRDSGRNYIELGEMLSSLTQWTPYIHRNLSHWITIYSAMAIFSQEKLQAPYLSVLERIWGVKYTGTYHFTEAAEKTSAWTLIALSIVWEGFNFSAQQTLQDFYQLIRCTIYIAFRLHKPYKHNPWVRALISPNFRATFSTGLGDALIQAARNADGVVSQTPTQIENQPEDSSPQEETHIFHRAAGILDEMGQVLKHETEGEQVDCGEERAREYWDNLRTHFEVQVHELEELVKETPETAEISS